MKLFKKEVHEDKGVHKLFTEKIFCQALSNTGHDPYKAFREHLWSPEQKKLNSTKSINPKFNRCGSETTTNSLRNDYRQRSPTALAERCDDGKAE